MSDTTLQEVRVSVQEVGFPASASDVPLELENFEGSGSVAKHQEQTQPDGQPDGVAAIVADGKLDDAAAPPLR